MSKPWLVAPGYYASWFEEALDGSVQVRIRHACCGRKFQTEFSRADLLKAEKEFVELVSTSIFMMTGRHNHECGDQYPAWTEVK